MSETSLAPLTTWLAYPLSKEIEQVVNRLRAANDVRQVVLLPDVHLASDVCNGMVIATHELIYPQAVGGDIGCGMATVPLDADANLLASEQHAARLLNGLYQRVPSNKHREARALSSELQSLPLSDARLRRLAQRDGRVQLGTLGRGNHFLEFQADMDDRLWVLVHSGSRGMGQAITRHHLSFATSEGTSRLDSLDAREAQGEAYLTDVAWARQYAKENRLAMLQAIGGWMKSAFGVAADWELLFNNDHNHVEREQHGGKWLWVHRKGTQRALVGEGGIVPGSMGAPSFHTSGRGHAESLQSCSHGAGRQLSRTEARQQIGTRALARQLGKLWYDHRRADHFRDEAPGAYKDIHAVMRAQRELVRIERELRPVLGYR